MAARKITSLLLVGQACMASTSCHSQCHFKLCNGASTVQLGTADKTLSGAICRGGKYIGVLNSDEPFVLSDTRISKYHPDGLEQKFTKSFFKTFTINDKRYGVGHEVPQQNQIRFPAPKCVILPFKAYEVLSSGKVVKNIRAYDPKCECIAFTTRLPSYTSGCSSSSDR